MYYTRKVLLEGQIASIEEDIIAGGIAGLIAGFVGPLIIGLGVLDYLYDNVRVPREINKCIDTEYMRAEIVLNKNVDFPTVFLPARRQSMRKAVLDGVLVFRKKVIPIFRRIASSAGVELPDTKGSVTLTPDQFEKLCKELQDKLVIFRSKLWRLPDVIGWFKRIFSDLDVGGLKKCDAINLAYLYYFGFASLKKDLPRAIKEAKITVVTVPVAIVGETD